jgi:hypothetical protein
MRLYPVFLLLACGSVWADEREIQRALIQRDQQEAEFAAGVRGRAALEALHERQRSQIGNPPLHPDPHLARELQPYERHRMAREREHVLQLPPPVIAGRAARAAPPPLPALPRHGVEPVTPDRQRLQEGRLPGSMP